MLLLALLACRPGPSIGKVTLLSKKYLVNRPVEIGVRLSADYTNPFNPEQVALDAVVTAPSGKTLRIPGFTFRPYERNVGKVTLPIAYASTEALTKGAAKERTYDQGEILQPTDVQSWRIRFTPLEPGAHTVKIVLHDVNGVATRPGPKITVSKSTDEGFVGIDAKNPRAFRLTSGQGFYPLGANIGWAGERGTLDYDNWLPEYGKVGANWGRVWLSPSWTTFALEQPGQSGRIDLANAWRMDYVLGLAAKNGMKLALCIDSYNVLRDRVSWPEWERSPFNRANGGPILRPSDFWTNESAAKLYRNKLRYIVARWGCYPNVFSWEFWNEVDGIADYSVGPVRAWHQRMGAYLRSIDPYKHLISTSYGGHGAGAGDASVFALPEMDYAVAHLYDAPDGPAGVVEAKTRLAKLNKPFFVAEFGADASGSRSDEDPTGLQLHDPLWASIASGASGGSMLWWWDSLIHPRRLYPILGSATKFMRSIDWGRAHFVEAKAEVRYQTKPVQFERRDVVLEGGPANWSPNEFNRPRIVTINKEGATGGPVAGFQHGMQNHLDLHNPVTFETNLPWDTTLDIEVGDVSGYGGAALKVALDGKVALDESYPDPDGDKGTETIKKFAGTRKISLPAGSHRVVVENLGADWVKVDYRFERAIERTSPPLSVWSSVGSDLALAWVRLEDGTWRNRIEKKQTLPPVPPSIVVIHGLKSGTWRAILWDTWLGIEIGSQMLKVGEDGTGRIDLPTVKTDLAVKFVRRS